MRSPFRITLGMLFCLFATASQAADSMPWVGSIEEARQIAAQQNRLILLHFWSYDCPPCKKLEQNVFPKPEFGRGVAANYVAVKINAKDNPDLAKQYKVDRWPVDVIITPTGEQLTKPTVSSQDPNKFLAVLDQVAATHRVQSHPPTQIANSAYTQPARSEVMPTQFTQPAESALPPRNSTDNPYASRAVTQPSQPTGRAWETSPAQPSTYGTQTPTRGANVPTGPQRGPYDTNAYGANAAPQRETQSRNSSCRPEMPVEGVPYVEGSTYRDPRADYSNGVSSIPANDQRPQPGADVAMPPLEVGRNAASSGSVYGPTANDPYAGRAPMNAQSETMRRDPVATAPSQPISQPHLEENRSVAQANPYAGEPSRNAVAPAPVNNPPLGLDGFCPVVLTESSDWSKGDVRFGAIHRGRTYLFATAINQQKFLANPDKYSPMLSGYDPVIYLETGKMVNGDREHGIVHDGQMYLFAEEATLDRFCKQPHAFTTPVQQAMRQSAGNVRR